MTIAPPFLRRSCSRLLLLLFLLFTVTPSSCEKDETNESKFVVAAYLPDYRVAAVNLNASAPFLTDLVLFSIRPSARGFVGGCCLEDAQYAVVREAREYKKLQGRSASSSLRIWVSVGGAGRSEAFPEITSDPNRRKRLIQSLIKLCETQGIDGIDFDWESPRTKEEMQNYMVLLVEASRAFHGVGLLVSIAVHPRQFLPTQIYQYVNRVNLMTYDMPGVGHAEYDRVVEEVNAFLQRDCPPSKLVVGIPAYARLESNPGQVRTFSELMADSNGEAILTNVWNGYRYDSPVAVKKKVEYAMSKGVAGVFLWELGHDRQDEKLAPGGLLLEAAASAAHGESQTSSKAEL